MFQCWSTSKLRLFVFYKNVGGFVYVRKIY